MKKIGSNAFVNCLFESIKIPPNVQLIKDGAFKHCNNLKFVDFSENTELTVISKRLFKNSAIESISFPSRITKICQKAFQGCSNLKITNN